MISALGRTSMILTLIISTGNGGFQVNEPGDERFPKPQFGHERWWLPALQVFLDFVCLQSTTSHHCVELNLIQGRSWRFRHMIGMLSVFPMSFMVLIYLETACLLPSTKSKLQSDAHNLIAMYQFSGLDVTSIIELEAFLIIFRV